VRALSTQGDPDGSPATYRWTVFGDLVPEQQQAPAQPEPQPKSTPPPQPEAQPSPGIVG
jgi:hypothetical protein